MYYYKGDFILNRLFKLNVHNKELKSNLNENNISHYLCTYDLLKYNFKDIDNSLNISYFSKNNNLSIIDPDKLHYYESGEKDNEVLIKKFKIRFSLTKEDNFSDYIVVSDSYDLDLKLLHHYESLIKIAIVKENIKGWINSNNLNDYDYIFSTNDDVISKLKNTYKNVFLIEEGAIYNQLNDILNTLYSKKKKKFYHFIHNKFDDIFPKWEGYFAILNSQYFDEEWYKNEYSINDNTDPVVHFIFVGKSKCYNPGPNFSSQEYYECNPDVKRKGSNPLVHYELFGKKENRFASILDKIKRDQSLILNSEFFDAQWYRKTYEIDGDDMDLAGHYLKIGYLERYNPGPDFSTFEYYQLNQDVKDADENPLLHYELTGKDENRLYKFSEDENQKQYDFILNSPYFDKEWYEKTYDISDSGMDGVNHYLKIGYVKNYNPGPDFSTCEYYECNPDVMKHGMNPLLHYEQYGLNEKRKIKLE